MVCFRRGRIIFEHWIDRVGPRSKLCSIIHGHLPLRWEIFLVPGQGSNVVKKENPTTAPESMQQRTTVRMGGRHINAVPCRCAAQNTSGCTLQANRQLKIHSKVENGKQKNMRASVDNPLSGPSRALAFGIGFRSPCVAFSPFSPCGKRDPYSHKHKQTSFVRRELFEN